MISATLKANALAGNLPKCHFSNELIHDILFHVDLYNFCQFFAPEQFVIKSYTELAFSKNHQIVISKGKNFAYDFGNEVSIKYIDFLKNYLGLSWYAAVYVSSEFLKTDISFKSTSAASPINTCRKDYKSYKDDINNSRIFKDESIKNIWAYLCNTRHILRSVVSDLYKNDSLYASCYGANGYNIHFPFIDHDKSSFSYGEIVGFEIVGANSNVRFKCLDTAVSHSYFSYLTFYDDSKPSDLVCFESVIDLLSFVSLVFKGLISVYNQNLVLISLRGLNYEIALKAQREFNCSNIYFFVDSDEPASKFLNRHGLDARFSSIPGKFEHCKDWNDILEPGVIEGFNPISFDDILNGNFSNIVDFDDEELPY